MTGFLGAIGTVIGLVRALPQLLRLLSTRDAHGVSLDTAATSCVVSTAWGTYGFLTEQAPVALASWAAGAVFAVITLTALGLGRRVRELRAAPVALAVFTIATVTGGSRALGTILAAGALVANVPQVVVAFREPDLTGLSPSTWALTASDGAVWLLYGAIAGDLPILVNNFFQFTTSAIIVVRRLAWSRSRPQLSGALYDGS